MTYRDKILTDVPYYMQAMWCFHMLKFTINKEGGWTKQYQYPAMYRVRYIWWNPLMILFAVALFGIAWVPAFILAGSLGVRAVYPALWNEFFKQQYRAL